MSSEELADPVVATTIGPWGLAMAAFAGLGWAAILTMLFAGQVDRLQPLFAPPRMLFCLLAIMTGIVTFLPLELRMRLPGLAFQGTIGVLLFFYTLAFVPPPTSWLLAPPDAPVYLLFASSIFWLVSAAALPVAFAIGRRFFRQRARRYDLRRARRQANEVGAAAAACVLLAGLRVLTPLGALLVVLIVVVAELLFLSFYKPAI